MAPKILVVEDDPSVGRTLARLLEHASPVVVAATAAEARRLVESSEAAWAGFVVDVGLPEGATVGLELLGDIRRVYPRAPAVVVTGRLERAVVNAAASLDAWFVCKPPSQAELAAFIARVQTQRPTSSTLEAVAHAAAQRFGLTRREEQVLESSLRGESSAIFCANQHISKRTFRAYSAGVISKAGATSLRDLAMELLRDRGDNQ